MDFNRKTSSSDHGTSTVYYPVVEYVPQSIQQSAQERQHNIRFQHDVGTSPPSYHRGDEVRVLYSPSNPDEAIIDEGWMNYFGPLLMVALGVIFTIVAVLIKQHRQKAAESRLELDF